MADHADDSSSILERLKRRAAAAQHGGDEDEDEAQESNRPILISNLEVMEMLQQRLDRRAAA